MIAIGSLGDVQPCVALASGLRAAGHDVGVATHARYATLVQRRGVTFFPVAEGNISRGQETLAGRDWARWTHKVVPSWVGFHRDAVPVMHERLADCWRACQDAEALVVGPLATLVGIHVADKARVPLVRAYFSPLEATAGASSGIDAGTPAWQRLAASAGRQAVWRLFRPAVNSARRKVLGLPPLGLRNPLDELQERHAPLLYGYSPAVVPRPREWGDWIHVTGYWFLDRPSDWQPPTALLRFLDAGPPPVFVGFGSMIDGDPKRTTRMVVEALGRAGQRGILAHAGSGRGAKDLPNHVHSADAVPHDWLFPRVAAVVHHGGAGTTASGLRAGRPSIIVPHFADQPFWGRRVYALGAGPRPLPRRGLSTTQLADAIHQAVAEPKIRHQALSLGRVIQAEDGIERGVEALAHSLSLAGTGWC